MRILITNDDGIESPILPNLARFAKKLGEVTLVAPKTEQSGKSQSIDFRQAVEVKKIPLIDGVDAYYIDSTPADCVRFAVSGLKRDYDLVISGVNRGFNLGGDIAYSGTIGAVLEASRYEIKGVAVSTDFDILMESERYFDKVLEFFKSHRLLEKNDLYNVNIPRGEAKGVRITKQGGVFYTDDYIHLEGDLYKQIGDPLEREYNDLEVDIDATLNGFISITPLTACKTNLSAFEKLK